MKKIRLRLSIIVLLLAVSVNNFSIYAQQNAPSLYAETFILMEPESGKILYAKDEHKKIYPASMTKILTAILLMEYLDPDGIYIAGEEVNAVPWDSSKAGHVVGEAISGHNLLRGLLMPSGNETSCIVALNIMKKIKGEENMSYSRAEMLFSELMNEKAKELGALNSNFVNPHGYHHISHYSTAYDIALITQEAMKYDLIMKYAVETSYTGPSADVSNPDPSWIISQYGLPKWKTHNQLIMGGQNGYTYATGLKTGFTDEAGDCLAATASKNGIDLIAVTCNSRLDEDENETRWNDSKKLFDYGFDNFSYVVIEEQGTVLGEIGIYRPRLGEAETITYTVAEGFSDFLGADEAASVEKIITFDEAVIAVDTEQGTATLLKAPIEANAKIGKIDYYINSELIFTSDILASAEVLERNFNSDVDYYKNMIKEKAFTLKAVPFWIGGFAVILLIIYIIIKINSSRQRRDYMPRRKY